MSLFQQTLKPNFYSNLNLNFVLNLFLSPIILATIFLSLFSSLFSPLPVNAAQFGNPDEAGNVIFDSASQENIYGAGSDVQIKSRVLNDAVVAGQNINFSSDSDISGGILAAGQTLSITPRTVGSSVRAAGQTITVSGFVRKDVLLAGQTVVLKNLRVGADVVISAQNIIVEENVVIQGNIYASTSNLQGKLVSASGGKVDIKIEENDIKSAAWAVSTVDIGFFVYTTLSSLFVLIALVLFLRSKQKLTVQAISFSKAFGIDTAVGAGILFLLPFITLISLFLIFGFSLLPLLFVVYGFYALVGLYLPIYIANFIKNTFSLSIKTEFLVAIVYLFLTFSTLVPVLNILVAIFGFFASLSAFGFVLRQLTKLIKNALDVKEEVK